VEQKILNIKLILSCDVHLKLIIVKFSLPLWSNNMFKILNLTVLYDQVITVLGIPKHCSYIVPDRHVAGIFVLEL